MRGDPDSLYREPSGETGQSHDIESSADTVSLFGLRISSVQLDQAAEIVLSMALGLGPSGYVVTPNVDHIVRLKDDPALHSAYSAARFIFADGMPIVWAARLLGRPLPGRVAGADLLPAVAERAAENGVSIFLLGGAEGVGGLAAANLEERHPGLRVVGTYSPAFGFDIGDAESHRAVEMVNRSSADIVFVGLGVPKQELWTAHHFGDLTAPVVLCTGAAADFAAGVVPRAPIWMRRTGMEWLFRLVKEPRRLWRRYLVNDVRFLPLVWQEFRRRHQTG